VDHLLQTLVAAVVVFAATNVDDMVVLTVLYLSSRATGKPAEWQIWVGQYAGIAALVAASAVAALGLKIVPERWVGLLGLVPLGLGVRSLITVLREGGARDLAPPAVATGMISVAGVTIANGGDNVSTYTPLFHTIGLTDSLITAGVFGTMTSIWCMTARWLTSHKRATAAIEQFGHWIVPAVFILIGTLILIKSGVIPRLLSVL
jgi:cadmium resistance transport/sequestration family protein